jgi:hypothetical protein
MKCHSEVSELAFPKHNTQMDDSSYRPNFDLGKKNKIHHPARKSVY